MELLCSFLFIYLSNYLFKLVLIHGYLFYIVDYNPIPFYLFGCLNGSSFVNWEHFHLSAIILSHLLSSQYLSLSQYLSISLSVYVFEYFFIFRD